MAKLTHTDLIHLLGEDDAGFLQTAPLKLLLLLATEQADLGQLARHEMASRGLNETGAWIGFPAAAKLWEAPAAKQAPGADEATIDAGLEVLAQVHMNIETLTERRMDSLDFHEVAVWQVKSALRAAFELGMVAQR